MFDNQVHEISCCQGLFYGGNVAGSRCPAGGTHAAPGQSGSADYYLPYGGPFG